MQRGSSGQIFSSNLSYSQVTDYRTEVSGVRPEDLAGAPDFKQVQTEVAELIKDRLLVGHAIHHDLKVFKRQKKTFFLI